MWHIFCVPIDWYQYITHLVFRVIQHSHYQADLLSVANNYAAHGLPFHAFGSI